VRSWRSALRSRPRRANIDAERSSRPCQGSALRSRFESLETSAAPRFRPRACRIVQPSGRTVGVRTNPAFRDIVLRGSVVGRESENTSRLRSQPRGRSIEDSMGGVSVTLNTVTGPSGQVAGFGEREKLEASVSSLSGQREDSHAVDGRKGHTELRPLRRTRGSVGGADVASSGCSASDQRLRRSREPCDESPLRRRGFARQD
jgi:hypothetical protein